MRRGVAVLLTFVSVIFGMSTVTSVAQAAEQTQVQEQVQLGVACDVGLACGSVYHYPERTRNELERPLAVRCSTGAERFVPAGQSDPCRDMDAIYIYSNEDLWCRSPGGAPDIQWEAATATGWHEVNDFFSRECAYKPDWA